MEEKHINMTDKSGFDSILNPNLIYMLGRCFQSPLLARMQEQPNIFKNQYMGEQALSFEEQLVCAVEKASFKDGVIFGASYLELL